MYSCSFWRMDGSCSGLGAPVIDVVVGLGGISLCLGRIDNPVFGLLQFP